MTKWMVVAILLVSFPCSFVAAEEINYPGSIHKLVINKDTSKKSQQLAKSVGLKMFEKYSYTDYVDIKKKFKIGIADNYDFLLFSTGGNAWDTESELNFNKQTCGWEITFYKNHDLSILHEVCRDADRFHSWVRILKVANGRRPNLNIE